MTWLNGTGQVRGAKRRAEDDSGAGDGGRLRRAARRLRRSLTGEREDLGHLKHRQRWLMGQFARWGANH